MADQQTEIVEAAWNPYDHLVNPMDQFDADWDWRRASGMGGFATGRIEDHAGGKNRPVWETEADLDSMRAAADVLCETSPAAISALKNLTNFVIGSGFVYTAAPEPGKDAPEGLAESVQDVIDEFLDDNDWCGDREREIFNISRRHGEQILSVVPVGDGQAAVRNVAAARVTEPKGLPGYGLSATFGVETPADDVERVLGYWIQWDSLDNQLEFADAATIEHTKINVDRGIKRGVSDFFAVEPDLNAARTLLRNMVKGGSIQASIAYIVEHAQGVTKTQLEDLRTQNATMRQDVTYQTGTKTKYANDISGGKRIDVGKGQTYVGSPLASGEAATAYVAILQAGLRSLGCRWCMPEYMISGDASNSNYSSTMVAESPFVRNCEVEQAFYKRRFLRVIWKAVEIACAAGKIEGCSDFKLLKKLIEIQVEMPQVAARNATEETSRRKVLSDAAVLSKKTWAGQEGLDYEQEQENIAQQPVPMAPVTLGPDGKPLPMQAPPVGPPGAKDGAKQSAVAAALESVRTQEEAKAILENLS